jgi:tetratricopeptide (TPR) repeat protein
MTKTFAILPVAIAMMVGGCGRSAAGYLEKGNENLAAGKTADAVLNYRKAIQKDPKLGEAYYRLGLALSGENASQAYQALLTASSLMPARDDVKIHLGDLCLQSYLADSNRPKRLYDQIQQVSKQLLSKDPNSVEGLRFKGYLALIDRRIPEAIAVFRSASAIAPARSDIVLPLTQALIEDKQFSESERLALEFIGRTKNFGPIYTVLYLQYLGTNRLADAERVLETKVANNPKEAAYRLELARHYAGMKDQAKLSQTVQTLLDHSKDFPQAYLDAGDFYVSIGRPVEAEAIFEEGFRREPKALVYRRRIAAALLAQGKTDEAAREVDAILKQDAHDREGRRIHALLLLEQGTGDRIDLALREVQKLAEESPEEPSLRFDLGRIHLAKHDLDAARADFRDAIARGGDLTMGRLFLAEVSLAKRQPADALRYVDDVLSTQPLNSRARFLRATCLMGQQLYGPARVELERLVKAEPGNRDARLQLGFLNLTEKRFSQAEATFRSLYVPGKGDLRALRGLAEVRLVQGQLDGALRLLQQELQLAPKSRTIRELLAEVAHRGGKYEVEIEQYQLLLGENPDAAELYLRLAQARAANGELKGAIETVEKAVRLDSKNAGAHIYLADLRQEAGQAAQAEAEYKEALALDPDNPIASNNLANMLAESGDADQALILVQRAIHRQPDQPIFSDTLGVVYLKKNMADAALRTFESLTKAYPDNPTFRLHLAMTLLSMGQKSRARAELQIALVMKPDSSHQRIKELLASIG